MIKASLVGLLSRLSKRGRYMFYAAAFFAGIALLDQFFLSPVVSKMRQMDQDIKSQQEEIKKGLMILSYERQIAREKDKYSLASKNPGSEEKEITAFLKDIENLAKESAVYLVDIKPSSGKTENGSPSKYFLELDFEAQMEQVFNFFYDITQSDQLLKIERYQIRPKTEGSSIVTCGLSISKLIVTNE